MIITKSEPFTKEEIKKLKITIESLSMDLKRVALGMHRGSLAMVQRFREEALKRELELEKFTLDVYLNKLLTETKKRLRKKDSSMAEDFLMYSTLFRNYSIKNL